MKVKLPDVTRMLEDVELPNGRGEFWQAVALEFKLMMEFATSAVEPEIVMNEYRKAGSQYIWEFWVNDLSRPREPVINWNGQNTGQWVYAGAIVLQNGRVSRHH